MARVTVATGAARGAVALALCLGPCSQAATLVRYPYVQNVRPDRVSIVWATDDNGTAIVQYSTDQRLSLTALAVSRRFGTTETGLPVAYFQHQAELVGLGSGTEYFYRIMVDGQSLTPTESFRTAGLGPFTFLVFADSGQDTPAQRQIARLMLLEMNRQADQRPRLILHAGDLAYPSGTFAQFQRVYFNYYRDVMKDVAFFPTPGNHEYETNSAAPYLAVHALPADDVPSIDRGRYYSFDWGNAHFVSVDSNLPLQRAASGTGAMLQWLESDLQRTRQPWKIVYFHHTTYPTTVHVNDGLSRLARERLVPILDRYSVDVVFNGHEHNYQRTKPLRNGQVQPEGRPGTVYVTTGGGGAALYPVVPRDFLEFAESKNHYMRVRVAGDRMAVQAVDVNGQELDRFELDRRLQPPPPPGRPQISAGGVVNAASFTAELAPGMLVSIFGQNLAPRPDQASTLPLPNELLGTRLTLNGQGLPLLFVSTAQVNAQLPYQVLGRARLALSNPLGSTETPVLISEAAPGIFSTSPEPAALHADGTLVSAASPARGGEVLALYLTGLGEVDGSIIAGEAAPTPPLTARAPVQVLIAGFLVTPYFSGLAPGFAGLYQINFEVPQGLSPGGHPVRVVARGISSSPVNLMVQ